MGEHGSFWPTVSNYRIVRFCNNVTYVTLKRSTYTSHILLSDIYLLFTQIMLRQLPFICVTMEIR